jgi:uncharacterized protein (TIGR02145 family)
MKQLFNLIFLFGVISVFGVSCSDDDDNNPGGGGGGSGTGVCTGGPSTVTDVDSNVYNVVTIGNQCWMKENLKTTKYRNGNPIPTNLSNTTWQNTTSGACAINSDLFNNNTTTNNSIYGKLYNWYAVADPRELCPVGWHVPSDAEWNELVKFLDPGADTSFANGLQSTIAGGMLKATGTLQAGTGLWQNPNTGATNSSGFTGLPGGGRSLDGSNFYISGIGWWWSSTQNPILSGMSFYSALYPSFGNVYKSAYDKSGGLSVRCVRD